MTLSNEAVGYDPDVLLSMLIRRYGSLPVLYEDPDYMYDEWDYAWRAFKNNFMKMWLVEIADYNALENYDKYSTIETEGENVEGSRSDSTTIGARSATDTYGSQQNSNSSSVMNKTTSFDSAAYDKATDGSTISGSNTIGAKSDSHSSASATDGYSKGQQTNTNESTVTEHTHGNIGVTTPAQMANQEYELRMNGVYERMAKKLANELLVPYFG